MVLLTHQRGTRRWRINTIGRAALFLGLAGVCAVAQTYTISTFAGSAPPLQTNIPGTSAYFSSPQAVATDQAGNVFFSGTYVVYRIDAKTGIMTVFAGTGEVGFSGDNGPATAAEISGVASLAVDTSGNVYIADYGNNRVRKVSNGVITTVAGNGQVPFLDPAPQPPQGDNGPATSAPLQPHSLAVDTAGNLYIAASDVIRKVSNGTITTVAGCNLCVNSIKSTSGSGPATNELLAGISGIAVDSAGNLYISEDSCDLTGVGLGGNCITVNSDTDIVLKVSNGIISLFAGNGTYGFSGDGGPATSAEFSRVGPVASDAAGNVYIGDLYNGRIRKVSSSGIITTIAGSATSGFSGDNGPAIGAQFGAPGGPAAYAIAADPSGNVYVADTVNNRIRKVSSGVVTTVAGGGPLPVFANGDGGPATSAYLYYPKSVAVDSSANVYIADAEGTTVRKISNGIITTVVTKLGQARALAVDGAGNLYIADATGNRIYKFSNGAITTVAGTGTAGFSGDGGPATSAMVNAPSGVAVDTAGNVYFADSDNNRIRKVVNGTISTVAGTGVFGFAGDNGPATSAKLSPGALAFDSAGNLYIADPYNNRVRKIAGGIITTVAGSTPPNGSSYGFSGDGGPAINAVMGDSFGIAVDAPGNLYIADWINNRVRKVSNGTITTIAGNGYLGASGDFGPATNATISPINQAANVAVDAFGDVFVATIAWRVRLLQPESSTLSITQLVPRSATAGGAAFTLTVYGSGYTSGATVQWNGTTLATKVLSDTQLSATVPASLIAAAGSIKVTVTLSTGTISGSANFSVIPSGTSPAPVISSLSPASVIVGAPGFTLTVNGTNFLSGSVAQWNGAALPTTFVSSTQLTASIAPNLLAKVGSIAITVANQSGATSNTTPFLIVAPPVTPTIYSYDTADRLIKADYGAAGAVTYAYDAAGNLISRQVLPASSTSANGPVIKAVFNAESGNPVIAPNTWVSITGTKLSPAGDTRGWGTADFVNNQLPSQLDGVSATVNGKSAFINYVSPTQVNILTPPDPMQGAVQVQLTNGAATSAAFTVQAQSFSPAFFVYAGNYVLAVHANGSLIGPANLYPGTTTPATPGETILLFANGFGPTSSAVTNGGLAQGGSLPALPVITIGGQAASVSFAGLISPGLYQFNVVVPSGAPNGDNAVIASYGGQSTQAGILLTVQR